MKNADVIIIFHYVLIINHYNKPKMNVDKKQMNYNKPLTNLKVVDQYILNNEIFNIKSHFSRSYKSSITLLCVINLFFLVIKIKFS